ncbi:uncharacterized protein LOC126668897 [Mercurialis annua]|uniref:uncharacterized protein LOC126668897 n=1 Tax=Mercurialis annua TaxID=3986 RepID=UPI00215EF871|nr:uncharacterized protein LOC126668897 [Mercurialis annua]
MLHRSFKPAKCKTALKLAASRIKLLKNKRDAQVRQLKRELAQLLESGQDQTARIRVEHVVREEKTMAAYDLIEIYCELIVARLPIIESQKNCPIDLKEAISSVIFASPRCADVPELMDVRKHFTAKYGKEFVSAAAEVRPDCGVSRLLVEKMSARAPDGPTKIKILSTIAEEHNVKWVPKSFGEKEMEPSDNLLNGPSSFQQASKINTQEPPNSVGQGPPSSGPSSKHYERHDAPVNSYGSNSRSSPHSQTFPSTSADPNKAMPSANSHDDKRSFGTGSEDVEFRHSYTSEHSHSSAGGRRWNMEFTDATAAAQAAAESAELASLAARAAAELSSQGRISRQQSTEPKKGSHFRSNEEGPQNNFDSRSEGKNHGRVRADNTSRRSNSGKSFEQSFENEQDDLAGLAERFNNLKSSNISGQSASIHSSSSSLDEFPNVSDLQMVDRHSRKASYEFEKSDLAGEVNTKRVNSEEEFANDSPRGLRSENVGYFEEGSIRKQSSSVFTDPHYQTPSDQHNILSSLSQQKFSEEANKESLFFDDGNIQRDGNDRNSFDNHAVAFDDSGSDDDELKFDDKEDYYGQNNSYFSSHPSAIISDKSPRLNMQDSLGKSSSQSLFASDSHFATVFSEELTDDIVPSRADDMLPGTFDHSDGPSSESEGELYESKFLASKRDSSSPHHEIAYTSNPEETQNVDAHMIGSPNMEFNRKTWKQHSATDSDVLVHSEGIHAVEVGVETETDRKFGYGEASRIYGKSKSNTNKDSLLSSVDEDIQQFQSLDALENSKPINNSSLENDPELNFPKLTGGFRNKAYRHPPYVRNASNGSSVSKEAEKENSMRIEQPSSSRKADIDSGARDQEPYNHLVHQKVNKKEISNITVSSSDSSDHEEPARQVFTSGPEAGSEGSKRSGLRSYFDSDKSDSEEDLRKENSSSKTRLGPGLSRRSNTPVSSSEINSSSKSRAPFKSPVTADRVVEQKSSSASSYATETQVNSPSRKNSHHQGRSERVKSPPEQASSEPVSQYRRFMHEESSSKSSKSIDTQQNHPSQSSNSFNSRKTEQRKSTEPAKSISESKQSSREKNLKPSVREQSSSRPSRTVTSGGAESTKTSVSRADPPSRENSIDKASHVHPKLPDYDTITAHLLSLRQNRQ